MSSQQHERPTTIRQDAPFKTVIQILEVDPDHQQTVVDALEQVLIASASLPDFLSAQVLRSLDGMRVAYYEQWVSEGDWSAGPHHPTIQKQKEDIRSSVIAGEPHFYDVCYVAHLHTQDETFLLPGMGGIAINEVTTTPVQQKALLTFMTGVDTLARQQPGYHSSNIHCSTDGLRNLNFVLFESHEVMIAGLEKVLAQVMQERPGASLQGVEGLGTADIHLYEVVGGPQSQQTASHQEKGDHENTSIVHALQHIAQRVTPALRQEINQVLGLEVTGVSGGTYTLDLRGKGGRGLLTGSPAAYGLVPTATVAVSDVDFEKLLTGQLSAPIAVLTGRLRLKGNRSVARKMAQLFEK